MSRQCIFTMVPFWVHKMDVNLADIKKYSPRYTRNIMYTRKRGREIIVLKNIVQEQIVKDMDAPDKSNME